MASFMVVSQNECFGLKLQLATLLTTSETQALIQCLKTKVKKISCMHDSHRQLEVLQKIKNHFPTIKLILVSSVKTVKAFTVSLQTLRL